MQQARVELLAPPDYEPATSPIWATLHDDGRVMLRNAYPALPIQPGWRVRGAGVLLEVQDVVDDKTLACVLKGQV